MHKFLKKTKNCPTYYASADNQSMILILESMIDTSREHCLVDSLSRGCLTSISTDCEQIFVKTEEMFRLETPVSNLRKICIPSITFRLMCQPDIISLINAIVGISGCNIEPEFKDKS